MIFHPFASWHCNFAVQHTDSTADPTDSWQKISSRLCKESSEQTGYTQCTCFGCEAQVSACGTQVYKGNANMTNNANQHRWVLSGPNAGQRASAVRVQL